MWSGLVFLLALTYTTVYQVCKATLTPDGQKNKRRNTGGIIRVLGDNQHPDRVIVIDVGKTFLSAAHELFPRYGLRRIDAVLLTHPHADGMLLIMGFLLYILRRVRQL